MTTSAADTPMTSTVNTSHVPLPLNDPHEAETEVCYCHQEVGQGQVVGEPREANGVHLVVAVEQIGLLQEALQVTTTHGGFIHKTTNVYI